MEKKGKLKREKEKKREKREDLFWKILAIFFLILIIFSILFVSMKNGYEYYPGKPWYVK